MPFFLRIEKNGRPGTKLVGPHPQSGIVISTETILARGK